MAVAGAGRRLGVVLHREGAFGGAGDAFVGAVEEGFVGDDDAFGQGGLVDRETGQEAPHSSRERAGARTARVPRLGSARAGRSFR